MPKYFVQWADPNNSVQRKGPVEHNGNTVFKTLKEARDALDADMADEREYNPNTSMTWTIFELPEPDRRRSTNDSYENTLYRK